MMITSARYSLIERSINHTTYTREYKIEIVHSGAVHFFYTPYEEVAKLVVEAITHRENGCLHSAGIV